MGSRLMHLITGETVASKPNIIRNKREFLTAASITLTVRILRSKRSAKKYKSKSTIISLQ